MENLSTYLQHYRNSLGLNKSKMAEIIGISSQLYGYYESGRNKPKQDFIDLFNKAFNKNLLKELETFVLKNELNEPQEPYIIKRRELKNNNKKRIPFYDAPAVAGSKEIEMTAIHGPAGTIDIGDLLHDSEAAIRIYGNSMLPNYPPGCVVGLSKCTTKFIEPGEVYVIETRDRRMLKRLFYKDDDANSTILTCYSDNTMKFEGGSRAGKDAYPPFNIPLSEIINLFVVTGVIKRNANSIIINR